MLPLTLVYNNKPISVFLPFFLIFSQALNLIQFVTGVKPSLYAKYYFELRQLFSDIFGHDKRFEWKLRPLSMNQVCV